MKTILGIDIGMSGALAFYDGAELIIYDMPVFERNKTKRLDCNAIKNILTNLHFDHAYIEQVNAFGMGVSSAYNFGWSCGVMEMAVASVGKPFTYVTPQTWKKAMQCPKDKDAARMRATQLFPNEAHQWSLKKHDGRAEASLICCFGRAKLGYDSL
jgi:crossover junction endodeoxyribonuclease RuvC